jgi:hypothetical protein
MKADLAKAFWHKIHRLRHRTDNLYYSSCGIVLPAVILVNDALGH